jgi:hypothetical protein
MSTKLLAQREATKDDRKAIFAMLLMHVENGELKKGSFVKAGEVFGAHPDTISRIWRATLANMTEHLSNQEEAEMLLLLDSLSLPLSAFPDSVFENKKSQCGRKRKYDRAALAEKTANLPLNERSTLRNHAAALGVSLKTSWNLLNEKDSAFKVVSSTIKPSLTDLNKDERLFYCLTFIDPRSVTTRNSADWQFREMFDEVHVDEKWFYLTKVARRYIMAADEEDPQRSTRHKSHIEKVMFLCAQARPKHDTTTNKMWDGKLGIWPIGEYTKAQRTSKKFKKGDMKWKNKNVDSAVYLDLMRDVVRQIASQWPRTQWNNPLFKVRIQQDGAKAHTSEKFMTEWRHMLDELVSDGVLPHSSKVILDTQPANSPDLNINDLGLFNALQAAYYKTAPRDPVDLIDCVKKAHAEYPAKKINHLWLTLQLCMNKIIENKGCNHYDIPHINKAKLEKQGRLPTCVEVTPFAAGFLETMYVGDIPTTEADNFEEDIDSEPLPPRLTGAQIDDLATEEEDKEN